MATVTVTDAMLQKADIFLSTYLTEKVPEADFSPGSAMRDLVVKSIAYVYAFLESEREKLRVTSSLQLIAEQPPGEDVDSAIDAYLSNLFLKRKTGQPTSLPTVLHFSRPTDIVLTPSVRFFRTSALIFASANTLVIPSTDLKATTTAGGATDWTYTLPLVSTGNGADYNVLPGRFLQTDRFNPYFTYAENIVAGNDGKGMETTAELLKRAPTALSTRNLVNERSVNAVLYDKFPALARALTTGMGDPEMMRDLSNEFVTGLKLHLGGHTDIYLGLPRTEVTETLQIGAVYPRADGRIVLLGDTSGVNRPTWAPVKEGQVLNIISGFASGPMQLLVRRVVSNQFIEVTTPFPEAATVTYSVGAFQPSHDDVLGVSPTGYTTASIQGLWSVYLKGRPVYRIRSVTDANGLVYTRRPYGEPMSLGQYQVNVSNPAEGQSSKTITEITMYAETYVSPLTIKYDTLSGYDEIQAYITSRFDRIVNASHLARGYNPVYVSAAIKYDRRYGAKSVYNRSEVSNMVTGFINDFDWTNTLDVSSISNAIRQAYPDIGVVYPFVLNYVLYSPDGRMFKYTSQDVATLFPREGSTATLTNGSDHGFATAYLTQLKTAFAERGVTDRTVRYVADLVDIDVWERATEQRLIESAVDLGVVTDTVV
jgi:hypothetical protein